MLRAPYHNAMRLGQGFNTFTQQLCMNDAVSKADELREDDSITQRGSAGVSQIVQYSSRFVDKLSDVTNAMNVSAALSIKTGVIGGTATGKFIDSDKFTESELNFFIQVSVTNQEHMPYEYNKFEPIPGLPPGRFTEVYGDAFISGWEEGGEFNAVVSVKLRDKSSATQVAASLQASLGTAALSGSVEGQGQIDKSSLDKMAETTISVNWSGGGQIKETDVIWDVTSLTIAAANFPDLVAMTPQRKYALLTKYSALKSFITASVHFSPLDYENAGIYAGYLLEIYTEYKSVWKNLQVLAWEVQEGSSKVEEAKLPQDSADFLTGLIKDGTMTAESDLKKWMARVNQLNFEIGQKRMLAMALGLENQRLESALENIDTNDMNDETKAKLGELGQDHDSDDAGRHGGVGPTVKTNPPPLKVYPASIIGLINARHDCRLEMVKVVNEVDLVTSDPAIALDPDRKQTFLSPALFKQLIPVGTISATLVRKPAASNSKIYYGNLAKLRPEATKSAAYFSDRAGKYLMSEPVGVTTKEEGDDHDVFFNDLDAIDDSDVPYYVRVHYDEEKIVTLKVWYTNGRQITHGLQTGHTYHGMYLSDADHANMVRLEAHKYKSRTLLDLFSMASDTSSMYVAPGKRASDQAVVTPIFMRQKGWNFRGFYGFITNEGGITGLGTIWANLTPDQTEPKTPPPPLFEDKDSPVPGSALAKQFDFYEKKGRFYRVGPCYNESKEASAHVFSMINWISQGHMPGKLDFCKDGTAPLQGIRAVVLTWTDDGPRTFPDGVKLDGLTKETLEVAKSRVTQAKYQFRKLASGKFCLSFVYLEFDNGSHFKTGFELSGDDLKAGGVEKWVKRPAPSEGKSWSLGGFYGQHDGDYIVSLGFLWVRDS
ncbi:hypothetical protein G647_00241 [Cladophialophora carrionii CBS 160.54]|uniref:Jacalin-type lectin domain-containing protein n=1 Tax=Cladophialophora carrionii CBS 160.54 TaxID=1279043 RepID=V9DPA6_9EURO|nr:uncharacterized protein G647_00241 [Cladophialophora carrionii CBS 160.54]ETI27792.1 hypothetical protein G647_00241 [Cladophialophora carrionii CBS 160.54]